MIFLPLDLKNFLEECKADIEEINYVKTIIDDSSMANAVSAVSNDQNLLLYGVLPDYLGNKKVEDEAKMNNVLEFLLVKKVNYSDLDNEDFINVMQETALAARKFVVYIYGKSQEGCGPLRYFEPGSENITPVWAKSGTNGYLIAINLDTTL